MKIFPPEALAFKSVDDVAAFVDAHGIEELDLQSRLMKSEPATTFVSVWYLRNSDANRAREQAELVRDRARQEVLDAEQRARQAVKDELDLRAVKAAETSAQAATDAAGSARTSATWAKWAVVAAIVAAIAALFKP